MVDGLEVVSRESASLSRRPPLLFVHGSCQGAWCWSEHFLKFFGTQGYGSYAMSLRGHGRSAGREHLRWTSVADYVQDVAKVAASLPRDPVVIGHSLGGLVVQKYLESHRAPAAVLLAPVPATGMLRSGWGLFARNPLPFIEAYLTLEPRRVFATPARARRYLFSDDLSDERVRDYWLRFGSESFRAYLEMIYSRPDPTRIRETPMLVVGGTRDVLVPTREIERTARIYGADVRIVRDAPHNMMLEDNWHDTAEVIVEWLDHRLDTDSLTSVCS